MAQSPRLALPYIAPAQAQKHVTHNEALRALDVAVQLAVDSAGAQTPPALPEPGEIHALGDAPTGVWAGQPGALALWTDGTWQFFAPRTGWRLWDRTAQILRVWTGSAWDPATDTENSPRLGINTGADDTNRLALASDASLFSHAGSDHRLKLNKAQPADTASLLYQTGFSGRAEMGLTGGDDFAIKVSPDGAGWTTALSAAADTGAVTLGAALTLTPGTAPAGAGAGALYFDAATATLRCHDGTGWRDLF